MAIARPVRALALAAFFMWCFFLYTIFRPTPDITQSSADFHASVERDPQLDRKPSLSPRPPSLLALTILSSIW